MKRIDDPLRRSPTRRGVAPRHGPRLTPGKAVVALAVIGAVGFIGYGLIRRDSAQIPILAAGLIVLGLTLVGSGFWSAFAAFRDARSGRTGRAFATALVGGFFVLAGTAALASAIVLSLIWRSA